MTVWEYSVINDFGLNHQVMTVWKYLVVNNLFLNDQVNESFLQEYYKKKFLNTT